MTVLFWNLADTRSERRTVGTSSVEADSHNPSSPWGTQRSTKKPQSAWAGVTTLRAQETSKTKNDPEPRSVSNRRIYRVSPARAACWGMTHPEKDILIEDNEILSIIGMLDKCGASVLQQLLASQRLTHSETGVWKPSRRCTENSEMEW
ncbi:hypothetical protein PANDA_009637 [Ailuropoda melanoleuca]|uniref:Uncharacterized protein n=1 Tax=Ailuropoda melanoleuca TaxID=9646 RepID=D2HFG6_AILME|nr:hypothetical protein PANDA_009637 [Ailuropoda melanoleuca]